MPNHKSEDYKLSAVDYYLTEDKSQEKVCKTFKRPTRSLMRWVDKYKQDGEIKQYNRTPVAYKIGKNEVKYILEEIKKNKTITMEDLLVKVKKTYRLIFHEGIWVELSKIIILHSKLLVCGMNQ